MPDERLVDPLFVAAVKDDSLARHLSLAREPYIARERQKRVDRARRARAKRVQALPRPKKSGGPGLSPARKGQRGGDVPQRG